MYIVELALKNSPMPLSVQKEEKDAADAAYDQALDAIKSGSAAIVELSCDKMPDKKVAVTASELAAVQVYEKSGGGGAGGRAPGFFALAEGEGK